MNWGSLDNFLHMGGYGLYVWGSYGVALLLMVAEPLMAAARRALDGGEPLRRACRERALSLPRERAFAEIERLMLELLTPPDHRPNLLGDPR